MQNEMVSHGTTSIYPSSPHILCCPMQYIINSLYPFVDLTHMYIIFGALGEMANAKDFFLAVHHTISPDGEYSWIHWNVRETGLDANPVMIKIIWRWMRLLTSTWKSPHRLLLCFSLQQREAEKLLKKSSKRLHWLLIENLNQTDELANVMNCRIHPSLALY